MTTERSWLIRTTQNQILGPVAKAKVIEFLEKGALGLNDEVTSGNGFWFSLKEKDLVDKFLYGDIPQGYNPISESKSILSKRDNPDKTTSLNTAPVNKNENVKTTSSDPAVLPKHEDLEYPDVTTITRLNVTPGTGVNLSEDIKLPNSDDLEFPDVTIVAKVATAHGPGLLESETFTQVIKPASAQVVNSKNTDEVIVYPQEDDLEFPKISNPSAKAEEEEFDFKVDLPESKKPSGPTSELELKESTHAVQKSGPINFKSELSDGDSDLTLVIDPLKYGQGDSGLGQKSEARPIGPKSEKMDSPRVEKRSIPSQTHHQPEKLLHERKVRGQQRETAKEPPKELKERNMPEELKKRNDNYLLYLLVLLILIIFALFFYYYRNILNKPLPV